MYKMINAGQFESHFRLDQVWLIQEPRDQGSSDPYRFALRVHFLNGETKDYLFKSMQAARFEHDALVKAMTEAGH